jgi:hypothetical protein
MASVSWIDTLGVMYNLTDPSTYYITGPLPMQGSYGLPIQIVSHTVPLLPGSREQFVQINPNDVRAPLTIFGADEPTYALNRRLISEAMRPTRGVGILQHTDDDGTVRQLYCRETSRFRDVSARGMGWCTFGLIFSAADPYWYDANWTTLQFNPAGGTNFFTSPFFPMHLSVGGISSAFTAYNAGQDTAWPIWTITGPATNPVFTNVTTNQVLTLNVTLTSAQVLTVDTRPLFISVFREDGSNQWATVSPTSQLWGLTPGSNAITISMSGTSSNSAVQLQYKQPWEGV